MDRRGFLKVLGLGGIAAAVAPKLILPPIKALAVAEPERRIFLPPDGGWPQSAFTVPPFDNDQLLPYGRLLQGAKWLSPPTATYSIEGFFDGGADLWSPEMMDKPVTITDASGQTAQAYVTDMSLDMGVDSAAIVRMKLLGLPNQPVVHPTVYNRIAGIRPHTWTVDVDRNDDLRWARNSWYA